ncbi:unnamed protein product [Ambrosiozyma monospora]|uniref:Unnamed protein product n=1 Tax=Ambrosiozyma monospora TaxID=43982 RepID=A0ACB5TBY0_AMBMO|nr:unnamed protein product [Ambrosiozyma monospora]
MLTNSYVDYAFVQFYNNPCSVDGTFNWDTWADYAANKSPNKNIKIFLGLPGSQSSAGSGYIDLSSIKSAVNGDIAAKNTNFGGVMLWDASSSYGNDGFVSGVAEILGSCKSSDSSDSSFSVTTEPKTSSLKTLLSSSSVVSSFFQYSSAITMSSSYSKSSTTESDVYITTTIVQSASKSIGTSSSKATLTSSASSSSSTSSDSDVYITTTVLQSAFETSISSTSTSDSDVYITTTVLQSPPNTASFKTTSSTSTSDSAVYITTTVFQSDSISAETSSSKTTISSTTNSDPAIYITTTVFQSVSNNGPTASSEDEDVTITTSVFPSSSSTTDSQVSVYITTTVMQSADNGDTNITITEILIPATADPTVVPYTPSMPNDISTLLTIYTSTTSADKAKATDADSTSTSDASFTSSSSEFGHTDCSSLSGKAKAQCLNKNYDAGLYNGSEDSCESGEVSCSPEGDFAVCNHGTWL